MRGIEPVLIHWMRKISFNIKRQRMSVGWIWIGVTNFVLNSLFRRKDIKTIKRWKIWLNDKKSPPKYEDIREGRAREDFLKRCKVTSYSSSSTSALHCFSTFFLSTVPWLGYFCFWRHLKWRKRPKVYWSLITGNTDTHISSRHSGVPWPSEGGPLDYRHLLLV